MRAKVQTLEQQLRLQKSKSGNYGIDESVPMNEATKQLKKALEKKEEDLKKRDQENVKLKGEIQKKKDKVEQLHLEEKSHANTMQKEVLVRNKLRAELE